MKIPTAIMMSGTGSNARKLLEYQSSNYDIRLIISDNPESNYREIAHAFGIDSRLNDIYRFYSVHHPREGLDAEDRKKLKDLGKRLAFDLETDRILKEYGIRLIATAGYDWIISPSMCRSYVIVNVHPGDLRVTDKDGRRKYAGLGWIPAARAILNGELNAYSSTHLVTAELDGGPIARVSAPVPVDLPGGITKDNVLPDGVSLKDIIRDINLNSGKRFSNSLIYTYSKSIQEKLKIIGDWVEFPLTLHRVSEYMLLGRLLITDEGHLQLDGSEPGDLFLGEV